MDIAYKLAEHVVNSTYENIPEDVLKTTKMFILDTIGVMMAGSSDPCCREVIKLIQEWGGKKECSILVFGDRVPSIHAAFANSMMAHALDFDDTYGFDQKTKYKGGGGHANASIVPAALAASEISERVSGKEFITAVAIGVDLMLRLGFTVKGSKGWTRSAICAGFGAAATAGYLLKLNEQRMLNAIGIAYSQASGNQQAIIDKSLVKRMQPAFAAKAGVLSALLAQRDITGAKDIFQGKFGFFKLYSGDVYDLNPLMEDLGKKYEGMNLGIKPYPCGRLIHPAIDCVLAIATDHKIQSEEVKEVLVYVPERTFYLVGAPFDITGDLKVNAQFSIPYGVSVAIINGEVSMKDFLDEARILDPRVVAMAQKIKVVVDYGAEFSDKLPVTVEIITANRGTFTKKVERLIGDPNYPLTEEQFYRKIISCAQYAIKPELSNNIGHIIETINHLEKIDHISKFISLLT